MHTILSAHMMDASLFIFCLWFYYSLKLRQYRPCGLSIMVLPKVIVCVWSHLYAFPIQNYSVGTGQSLHCEVPGQFHLRKPGRAILGHRLGSKILQLL